MNSDKIITIVGARPQFIKVAPVSNQIRRTTGLREILVHTGQHYDSNMSAVFFEELGINKPDYNLGISGGSHGAMTGQMLENIEAVLLQEKPRMVLVYGDTNSTLAGALAASKLHIPIAHIESGLRSFNKRMPEEINRILTDHCSSLLFVPTNGARENLLREGIDEAKIVYSGDVMFDACLQFSKALKEHPDCIRRAGLEPGHYVLSTIHRQENTDQEPRLQAIFEGLAKLNKTIPVLLPLHPRTKSRLEAVGLMDLALQLNLVDPVGYLDMLAFEKHASAIVTDSGGVQKEAYFNKVPCVTLRDETEWVELIDTGWNRLVPPTEGNVICQEALAAMRSKGQDVTLYGGGKASQKVASVIDQFLT
ncbi:non-hydrolyzing UDP-N-acetylglucosamine 2-epimerase [uncultured Cohaesibacter sp.]|uniref:non-hydrolyzing UDP-N-acetylglucosamine 2-epimerase n=1 Tax=uncultured Cohaesibacter sp. TaxID=1002546 RepID=UPI0029C85CD8|nr:UDP-N-acetylglucosamine 2-epimerase (non-hydrolyzing) [uncultured Cohaesibacter sp.]